MADLNHSKTTQQWQQDDPEDLLGFDMDDDELFFDDDAIEEELPEMAEDIPSWRRIEMAREDRFLKEAMADFEDYDEFEDYWCEYTAESSH
jgi:hypothetical protein